MEERTGWRRAVGTIINVEPSFAALGAQNKPDDRERGLHLKPALVAVIAPQQFAKLNNLAFQAAATRVCKGFELDEAKFTDALGEAAVPRDGLSPEEIAIQQDFVLVEFGMRYGLLIAEGKTANQSFCANADALRTSDVPNVWE